MPRYGLGDAQIDAQNATTAKIGEIKGSYNAVKASGRLTVNYILSAHNQLSQAVDVYMAQYGNTSRGRAGGQTLTDFLNNSIFPELDKDLQAVQTTIPTPVADSGSTGADPIASPYVPPDVPASDPGSTTGTPSDAPYDPATDYTNPDSGNHPNTPGNTAPQQTPQAPASGGSGGTTYIPSGNDGAPATMGLSTPMMIGLGLLALYLFNQQKR